AAMSPTRRSAVGLWVGIVGVLLLAGGGGILLATPRQKGDAPAAAAPVASSVVAAVGGPKGLYPDAAGRLRVRIADREPARLPSGGDVREAARDDQAAQLYVIFPRWPSPRTASDVIGYVWDSRAPTGTRIKHPRADNVRIVVVESGPARLSEWRTYERNVAADYTALFGRQPPRVGKLAVMVDSNDTRGEAEALFGDLIFARTPQGGTEIPTPVLR